VPNAGTLKVLPLIKEATAFVLQRPLSEGVPKNDFCGAIPGKSHDISSKWHDPLMRAVVPIPDMAPGDTVWWHGDLVHAVEAVQDGGEDSSVFYIPVLPATVSEWLRV
jgi:hypothetical protein